MWHSKLIAPWKYSVYELMLIDNPTLSPEIYYNDMAIIKDCMVTCSQEQKIYGFGFTIHPCQVIMLEYKESLFKCTLELSCRCNHICNWNNDLRSFTSTSILSFVNATIDAVELCYRKITPNGYKLIELERLSDPAALNFSSARDYLIEIQKKTYSNTRHNKK